MSDSATSWTAACQAPLSMGFPRQEYLSGLPFPSPGYFNYPNIHKLSSQYVNNIKTKLFKFLHCLQNLMSIYIFQHQLALFQVLNHKSKWFNHAVSAVLT